MVGLPLCYPWTRNLKIDKNQVTAVLFLSREMISAKTNSGNFNENVKSRQVETVRLKGADQQSIRTWPQPGSAVSDGHDILGERLKNQQCRRSETVLP